MQRATALLSLCFLGSACAGPPNPPAELAGLWSAGPAACAAGVGVRFEADEIQLVYEDETQTLFDHPRYKLESGGETFRVRIIYQLPQVTGGARVAGAHGVLVLARQPDGSLAPLTHSIIDGRTGSARMRIADDPAVQALTLAPCGAHPWREDLRGRA
ncbi:hypothetical protein [Candidatus Viadribacter manganicus]|uniref:hypothetical protein n=1 Tax=Candidatus Viadribacter manganicus TaxID=1759059 RepID=UPI000AD30910|nr:hypothetical protein [Candidatus Viadribacter manganicus]